MKIGILTHYYKSVNYGGVLQALALQKFLSDNGFNAEQICYEYAIENFPDYNHEIGKLEPVNTTVSGPERKGLYWKYYKFKKYIKNKRRERISAKKEKKFLSDNIIELNKRYENFYAFENSINHSEKIYSFDSVKSIDDYDVYIVGSDQVWNFRWFNPIFFLEGVQNAVKIAYSASSGNVSFTDEESEYLKRCLSDFDLITTRETELSIYINNLFGSTVSECVLDPVFLLGINDWKAISSERLVSQKYIFCYFLGKNPEMKKSAEQYAKAHSCSIVTIQYVSDYFENSCYDEAIYINSAGPCDFISLINYADCVFTDSFHAVSFSLILNKQFFVFSRVFNDKIDSRLINVLQLFNCGERAFDGDSFNLEKAREITEAFETYNVELFEKMKQFSRKRLLDFLNNNK